MADLRVSVQASNGDWLVAEAAEGGDRVRVDRRTVGEWETFALDLPPGFTLVNGAPVRLRTHRGRYLCALNGGGGEVTGDRPEAKAWETFRIEKVGGGDPAIGSGEKVALRTDNGHYVVAEGGGGGRLRADRKQVGAWETFTLAIHGPGGPAPAAAGAGAEVRVVKMGYWDCPSCGQKRIQGPERTCTGCGTTRGEGVKFYTDDGAAAVTDPALLARAKAGADWHCAYCGADNPAGSTQCTGCGGGADGTKRRAETFKPAPGASAGATPAAASPVTAAAAPGGARKPNPASKVAVLAVIALIASCVYYFAIYTKDVKVKVEKISWTKALALEALGTTRGEAWAGEVPSGSREISRRTEPRTKKVQEGTDRVKVGTKDLGNGLFEDVYEDRPRYVERKVDDTWVVYEREEWKPGRRIEQTANDGAEPPDPVFRDTPRERVRKRENLVVILLRGDDGKGYDYKLDLEEDSSLRAQAQAYKVGESCIAVVGGTGNVRELKR